MPEIQPKAHVVVPVHYGANNDQQRTQPQARYAEALDRLETVERFGDYACASRMQPGSVHGSKLHALSVVLTV